MYGAGNWMTWGMTDANEIPDREAFEWYKADTGKGMAIWYKNSGPWWDSTNLVPNDGISLEEQRADSASLWNFYRAMIRLRNSNKTLVSGQYQTLQNNNDSVFTFLRYEGEKTFVVATNFSGRPQEVIIESTSSKQPLGAGWEQRWGKEKPIQEGGRFRLLLPAYSIDVWETFSK